MSFIPGKVRGQINVAKPQDNWVDEQTSQSPEAWRGFALDFEFAFFVSDDALMDLTGFGSITVEIHDNAFKVRPAVATITCTDFNNGLSIADWQAETAFHCRASFAEADMALDLGTNGDKKTFWIFVHGIDSNGKRKGLGGTTLTLRESGVSTNPAGPNQGGNLIPGGAVYDGSGNYVVAVTQDRKYEWTKGAHDTSIVNGAETYTATQQFTTLGTSVTLKGTTGASVTAILRYPLYPTLDEVQDILNSLDEQTQSFKVFVNGGFKRTIGVDAAGGRIDQVEAI